MTAAETGQGPPFYRSTHELTDGMREFLLRHRYSSLATLNSDGSINLVPVFYRFDGGRFLVATASTTRKARNIAAGRAATLTVEDRETSTWVSAKGIAELISGAEAAQLNQTLYRTWLTDEGLRTVGTFMADYEDVTIALTPTTWQAWDFASTFLPVLAEAGVPVDDLDRLFVL